MAQKIGNFHRSPLDHNFIGIEFNIECIFDININFRKALPIVI